jgi:hypothetical protein
MPTLTGYNNESICAEIGRRAANGSDIYRYDFLQGTLTFYGRPVEYPWGRSSVKKGSQREIALRSVFTDKQLMKEIQDRILKGERHAYNEYMWIKNMLKADRLKVK